MIRSNSRSLISNSSSTGKAISASSLIGVASCLFGGRRMVKWISSTDGIGLQQVAPGALARIGLAGDQQHLEPVAHAVDREHRRVVDEGQLLVGFCTSISNTVWPPCTMSSGTLCGLPMTASMLGDLLAVAADGDLCDALRRAAEVVDLEGDVDALADQAKGRRLRDDDAAVLAGGIAGHGEMHRRGDAELARGRRHVVHLAVGHQHEAGKALLRNVGQRLAHGVEQLGALLGMIAAALGLHHAQLEVLELLRGLAQLGDGRVGVGGAVLQVLAGRAVDHRQRDVLLIGALLLDQRGIEQDRGQRRARQQAQQRAARPAQQRIAHQQPGTPRRGRQSATRAATGRGRSNRRRGSLPEPFQDRRHVHLVGLVVAGQRIHDDVDAEADRPSRAGARRRA